MRHLDVPNNLRKSQLFKAHLKRSPIEHQEELSIRRCSNENGFEKCTLFGQMSWINSICLMLTQHCGGMLVVAHFDGCHFIKPFKLLLYVTFLYI